MNCKKARQSIVLDYYGELDEDSRRRLEEHIRSCRVCAADREETVKILSLISAERSDTVPAFDAESSWRKIEAAGLRPTGRPEWRFAFVRRWRWSGAALILILVTGILIGRFVLRTPPQAPSIKEGLPDVLFASESASAASSARPVLASHWDDLKPILLDFVHSANGEKSGAMVEVDERLLRGLLLQNLLLRRAMADDDPVTAELLDDLDLVLKEIVNRKGPGAATKAAIRNLIRDRDILFRMQILKTI